MDGFLLSSTVRPGVAPSTFCFRCFPHFPPKTYFPHFLFPVNPIHPVFCEVRWALQNEAHIQGSIDKAIEANFPGTYRSRRYCHWKKQYYKYNWESLPDHIAARVSQVPNRFRKLAAGPGAVLKGPSPKNYDIPASVGEVLEKQLDVLIEGENEAMPRAEHVNKKDLESSIEWLCNQVNAAVTVEQKEVEKRNKERLSNFANADGSAEDLAEQFEVEPKVIKAKDFKHLAHKLAAQKGLSKQSCNTSGNYLSFNDVKMQELLVSESTVDGATFMAPYQNSNIICVPIYAPFFAHLKPFAGKPGNNYCTGTVH